MILKSRLTILRILADRPRSVLPFFACLLVLLQATPARAEINVQQEASGTLVGAYDFYYYYCAVKLFSRGENPYDRGRINEICAEEKTKEAPPSLALVYPPWTLVFFYPLKYLPFRAAAALWYVFNICFAAGAAILTARVASRQPLLFPLVAVFALPPIHETLEWGQISLFVTFGVALALWALERRRDALAGIALAVAAIKYHLLFLWGLYLVLWVIKERRFGVIIWGVLSLGALSAVAEVSCPGVFADWLSASRFVMHHGQSNQTANLLGVIRSVYGGLSPAADRAAMLLLPAFAACATFAVFARRGLPSVTEGTAVLLCLSVAFAPYAWFHDFSLLLITVVLLLSRAYESGDLNKQMRDKQMLQLYLPVVLGLQFLTVAVSLLFLRYQSDLFWYPLAVLALWFWAARRGRISAGRP